MKMRLKAFLLILTLTALCACNNSRNPRLSLATVCDTEFDLASFELLEDEVDDLELVTGGLPSGNTYETTGFTLTKIDGNITTTFAPVTSTLFTDEPRFGILCTNGFEIDTPASGAFSFTVPILSEEQEMNDFNFPVDYDVERNNDDPVINVSDEVTVSPLAGVDVIGALTSLGYDVDIYTPNDGSNQNVVFTAHARILAEGITLRLQIRIVEP